MASKNPSSLSLNVSKASCPSIAATTWAPADSKRNWAISRLSSLSSTRSTRTPSIKGSSISLSSFSSHKKEALSPPHTRNGSVMTYVVPTSILLSNSIVPFIISHKLLAIGMPKPVPSRFPAPFRPSWANGSKTCFLNSSLMPIPVSSIVKTYVPIPFVYAVSQQETWTSPPSLLYFTALLMIFISKRFKWIELA